MFNAKMVLSMIALPSPSSLPLLVLIFSLLARRPISNHVLDQVRGGRTPGTVVSVCIGKIGKPAWRPRRSSEECCPGVEEETD